MVPTTLLLDRRGVVAARLVGYLGRDDLAAEIEKLF